MATNTKIPHWIQVLNDLIEEAKQQPKPGKAQRGAGPEWAT